MKEYDGFGLQGFRRTLNEATQAPMGEGLLLCPGPESAVEAVDAARKLAFFEQIQIVELNRKIVESGLLFPFEPVDIRRADPLECDVLLRTEKVIKPDGSDHAMALIGSTRGVNSYGEILRGKFDPIFMTEEAYRLRGGKIIVLTDANSQIPPGEVRGVVHIKKELLGEINEKLVGFNRKVLSPELACGAKNKGDEIIGYEIIPDEPSVDKGNSWFYKRGHIGLVLKFSSGKARLLTHNALNEKDEEGSINLVRFTDGKYGMVNTVRMLVGARAVRRPEVGRGYADMQVEKYKKRILKKYGLEMNPDQLGMELGLALEKAIKVETKQLRQDFAYENVSPKLQILDFDKSEVIRTAPDHIQHMLEEFEGLTPTRLNPSQILDLMDGGIMVDAFSMATFASEFLGNGLVDINPRYQDDWVVLEKRSLIQLGGKVGLVVPQGPAFEGNSQTVGQVHPNTGNARFWYQARFSYNPSVLTEGPMYVKVGLDEIKQKLIDLEFSTVDAAVLFRTLYKQRVFIQK